MLKLVSGQLLFLALPLHLVSNSVGTNRQFKYYLKHRREFVRKIQHEEACRKINTAQGEAECCIYLETRPRVLYFLYKRAQGVL